MCVMFSYSTTKAIDIKENVDTPLNLIYSTSELTMKYASSIIIHNISLMTIARSKPI